MTVSILTKLKNNCTPYQKETNHDAFPFLKDPTVGWQAKTRSCCSASGTQLSDPQINIINIFWQEKILHIFMHIEEI